MANENGSSNVSAYTINATTGALTPVPGSPFEAGLRPFSVVVDPTGKFAYVANYGSNNVSAYTINAATGALTPVPGSPFAAGSFPWVITVNIPANLSLSEIRPAAFPPTRSMPQPVPCHPFPARLSRQVAVPHPSPWILRASLPI